MAENLYCPRCGKQFTVETSYCRTCGLSLDSVVDLVVGEKESAPIVTSRPNFKLFRIGFAIFIFGLVIGLINGAMKDFQLYPDSFGKLLFLVTVAAGMLTLGAGFLFPTKKYTKRKANGANSTEQSSVAELDAAKFDANVVEFQSKASRFEKVPVPSVTERTTRNLKDES